MRPLSLAALSIAILAAPAAAQVYKCTDAKGKVTFQESPCDANLNANKVRTQGSSGGFTAPAKKDEAKDAPRDERRMMAAPPMGQPEQAPRTGEREAPKKTEAMAHERKFITTGQQRDAVIAKLGQPDNSVVNTSYLRSGVRIVDTHTDTYEPASGDEQTRTRIRYRGEVVEQVTRETVR